MGIEVAYWQAVGVLLSSFASGFMLGYYVGSKRENPYSEQEVKCFVPYENTPSVAKAKLGVLGEYEFITSGKYKKVKLVYKGDRVYIVVCDYYVNGVCRAVNKPCIFKPQKRSILQVFLRRQIP